MLTLTSNLQAEALIKDGILAVADDIEIAFDGFCIESDIKCRNIYSKDKMRNIETKHIIADNVSAGHIKCWWMNAEDINSLSISCDGINAMNLFIGKISYRLACVIQHNIICNSIFPKFKYGKHFCLDGKIIIREEKHFTEFFKNRRIKNGNFNNQTSS